MGMFSRDSQKAAANREYTAALKELERVASKKLTVTDELRAASQRVTAAEKNVPWWQR